MNNSKLANALMYYKKTIELIENEDSVLSCSFPTDIFNYTGTGTPEGGTVTKQERIYKEKEKAIILIHRKLNGEPREIKEPEPDKKDYRRFWHTKTPDNRNLTAKSRPELIEKLFSFYELQLLVKKDYTFAEVFELALENYKKLYPAKDSTYKNYKSVFKRCFSQEFNTEYFKKLKINSIGRTELEELFYKVIGLYYENFRPIELRGERLKKSYFSGNFMVLINLVFEYAANELQCIDSNPVSYFYGDRSSNKKQGAEKIHYFYSLCAQPSRNQANKRHSDDEYVAILQEALRRSKSPTFGGYSHYLHLIAAHPFIGCRPAELVVIKWTDIEGDTLHIRREQKEHDLPHTWYEIVEYTKNERGDSHGGRNVVIHSELRRLLDYIKNQQKEFLIESEYIFCNSKGDAIPAKDYEKNLCGICKKLGIDSKGTYTFRRDFNNRLGEAGVTLFERAGMMGHAPRVNEEHYDSFRSTSAEIIESALGTHTRNVEKPW